MEKTRIRNWNDVEAKIDSTAKIHGNRASTLVENSITTVVTCPLCGEQSKIQDAPDLETLSHKWRETVKSQMLGMIQMVDVVDMNVEEMEKKMMEMVPIIRSMKNIMGVMKETEVSLKTREHGSEEMADVLIDSFAKIERIIAGMVEESK